MRATAPGGGASATRLDDGDRVAGLAEDVGEARRLVGGEHDPGAVGSPGLDGLGESTGTTGRQDRLPPAERIARRQPAAGHRGVLGRHRFPGQLERPRGDEAALPVARRQVGRRPVLRQLAGLDQLRATLVGLAPQERRPPRRCRPARRARGGCPDRCGRGRSPGRGGRPRPRRRRRRPSPGSPPRRAADLERFGVEAGEVGGEPLREPRGGPAEAVADRGGAARRAAGTRRRAAARPGRRARRCAGRSGRRSAASRSRRRRTRSGSAAASTAGRRRRCRRAARTRRGRRPRGRARSRGRTARAAARPGGSATPTRSSRGASGRSAGSIVCWRSAWTLATRMRARPLRHAARAATRAAVSSATSSLRS